MMPNPNKSHIPWLPVFTLTLQLLSLVFVTLILTCPTPFEHNSISLFVVAPRSQLSFGSSNTNASSPVNLIPPSFSTNSSTSRTSTTTATPSDITRSSSLQDSSSPTPTNGDINASLAAKEASTTAPPASKRDDSVIQPIANTSSLPPLQQLEARPNMNSGNLANSTNSTSTVSSLNATSKIMVRLGPLGSCYRTAEGHETCTAAKLRPSYIYSGLQQAVNAATSNPSSSSNASTTMGTMAPQSSIDVASLLPQDMTVYPTLLLIIIIVLICTVLISSLHVAHIFRQNQAAAKLEEAPKMLLSAVPWMILTRLVKWAILASALILLIASGIKKYQLSSAKNTFNSANVSSLASGKAGSSSQQIPLEADTGSAFGFAWTASVALLVTFWFQRVYLRRHSALEAARKELREGLPSSVTNLTKSAFSMRNMPPSSGPTTVFLGDRKERLQPPPLSRSVSHVSYESHGLKHMASLPSLHQAHEGNIYIDQREIPPFASYQTGLRDMPQLTYNDGHDYKRRGYDNAAAAATAPTMRFGHSYSYDEEAEVLAEQERQEYYERVGGGSSSGSGWGWSRAGRRDDPEAIRRHPHLAQKSSLSSLSSGHGHGLQQPQVRSPSPAPSYWTSEWSAQDKERERQYMAELRRQRAAINR